MHNMMLLLTEFKTAGQAQQIGYVANIIFQHPVALRYNLESCFPSIMQQY
jgi:hypothetical protein